MSSAIRPQMEAMYVWGQTVHGGTARGQSGGNGAPVHGPAEWVSSRGSEPSSVPIPTARGVQISWEETWSIASVTSSPAQVRVDLQMYVFDCTSCFEHNW